MEGIINPLTLWKFLKVATILATIFFIGVVIREHKLLYQDLTKKKE